MTQPKHTIQNIDHLINNIPEAQPINYAKKPAEAENTENKSQNRAESAKSAPETPEIIENNPDIDIKPTADVKKQETPENSPKIQENSETSSNVQQNTGTSDTETDEYGNPVAKPKMYTEEEVQKKIRDRLKRGIHGQEQQQQQPSPQQVQQATDSGFQYNEDSQLSWSQQLEHFVENTMEKVSQRKHQQQQQALAKQNQAEFESKFHAGMAKYPDFIETMADKVITDDMVMAVRGLTNPAAFLYTAAKRMPQELERISKIQDPYVQVAEMGRLHEKLSKPKPSSNAPRPLSQDRSDITDKTPAKVNIDHLIAEDAVKRYRR